MGMLNMSELGGCGPCGMGDLGVVITGAMLAAGAGAGYGISSIASGISDRRAKKRNRRKARAALAAYYADQAEKGRYYWERYYATATSTFEVEKRDLAVEIEQAKKSLEAVGEVVFELDDQAAFEPELRRMVKRVQQAEALINSLERVKTDVKPGQALEIYQKEIPSLTINLGRLDRGFKLIDPVLKVAPRMHEKAKAALDREAKARARLEHPDLATTSSPTVLPSWEVLEDEGQANPYYPYELESLGGGIMSQTTDRVAGALLIGLIAYGLFR